MVPLVCCWSELLLAIMTLKRDQALQGNLEKLKRIYLQAGSWSRP